MADEIYQWDKSKTSLADNLLQKTASPFTVQVAGLRLPETFKVLDIATFTGFKDPIEHLENYGSHLDLHGTPEEIACRAFPLTLQKKKKTGF